MKLLTMFTILLLAIGSCFAVEHHLPISVTNGTGSPISGYQVHLFVSANEIAIDDPFWEGESHLRVTDTLGAELPYWIHYFDASHKRAELVVKADLEASVTNLTLVYGDTVMGSPSSGGVVFNSFTGCESGSEMSSWSVIGGVLNPVQQSTVQTASGNYSCNLSGTNAFGRHGWGFDTGVTRSTPFTLEYDIYLNNTSPMPLVLPAGYYGSTNTLGPEDSVGNIMNIFNTQFRQSRDPNPVLCAVDTVMNRWWSLTESHSPQAFELRVTIADWTGRIAALDKRVEYYFDNPNQRYFEIVDGTNHQVTWDSYIDNVRWSSYVSPTPSVQYNDGVLMFEAIDRQLVRWQQDPHYTSYNLYRGSLSVLRSGGPFTQLPGSNPYAARYCGLTDPLVEDPFVPSPSEAAFYLVSGNGPTGEAPLGDGAGVVRPNANPCVPPLQDLMNNSRFATKVVFPSSTGWSLDTIRNAPGYSDWSLREGFLVKTDAQFSDWQVAPIPHQDPQDIPAGIGIQYAIGSDNSIYVFTDADLPNGYMPLFGFMSLASLDSTYMSTPYLLSISNPDVQRIWDSGLHLQTDWTNKFLTLPQMAMTLYKNLVTGGLVEGPLDDPDIFIQPTVSILNNTGRRVAIVVAGDWSDCRNAAPPPMNTEVVRRWWPKGLDDRCGTAEWGFSLEATNPGGTMLGLSSAAGDNLTSQSVRWDDAVFVQHNSPVGSTTRYTTNPADMPGAITLGIYGAWSANWAAFAEVLQADQVIITNRWESPQVGAVPEPIVAYVETGWH